MTNAVGVEHARRGSAYPRVSEPGSPRPVTPVGIVAGRLEQLLARFETVVGADEAMITELREISELASGLDPYLSQWTSPESPALRRLAQATGTENWARHSNPDVPGHLEQEMLSGHVEGQVLKMLVHATRARRVLEIGMFTGYSALAIAEALPDDGQVVACEIDPDVAAFAQRYFSDSGCGDKIVVEVGPASATLQRLSGQGEMYDLVFIDADKAGYVDYFAALLDGDLLGAQALICVDNTLMQGQPWTAGEPTANGIAIAQFNQTVAADPRVEQVIIPLRDGLTLIRRVDTG